MITWSISFDGLCEPNPGGVMGLGALLDFSDGGGEGSVRGVRAKDGNTNNIAEWGALFFGLTAARARVREGAAAPDRLVIRGDSQLVIHQLNRKWQCKNERMAEARDVCLDILKEIGVPWNAEWILREQNERADSLSKKAYFEITGRMPPERILYARA